MLPNEYVFHGKRDINYLFHKGAKDSPFLLVSFQAVPSVKNGKPVKLYNYKKFLKEVNLHRLFIEDTCGDFGCYYLCNNMNFDVEETVIELIETTMAKYNIKKENVIVLGSSKGGTSALYYGLKYGFGHIISGAPQTKIASYLKRYRPEMLEYMIGKDLAQENIDKIDAIVLEQVKPTCTSKINLLTSTNDSQYEPHIMPLVDALKKAKIEFTIAFEPRVEKHKDIATYFPNFLAQHVLRIINETYNLATPKFKYTSNAFSLHEVPHNSEINTLIQIVSATGKIVEEMTLDGGDYFEFKTDELLPYSAVHTLCIGDTPLYSTVLCDQFFDQGCFDYNGYSMRFNGEAKELEFKINIEPHQSISFAFSLVRGRDVIVPNFHSNSPEATFPISESGTYVVRFTIKVKGKGNFRKSSKRFPVAVEQ